MCISQEVARVRSGVSYIWYTITPILILNTYSRISTPYAGTCMEFARLLKYVEARRFRYGSPPVGRITGGRLQISYMAELPSATYLTLLLEVLGGAGQVLSVNKVGFEDTR